MPPSAIFAADHMLMKSPASGEPSALSRPAPPLSSRDQLKANHAAYSSVIASSASLNVRAIACLRAPVNRDPTSVISGQWCLWGERTANAPRNRGMRANRLAAWVSPLGGLCVIS